MLPGDRGEDYLFEVGVEGSGFGFVVASAPSLEFAQGLVVGALGRSRVAGEFVENVVVLSQCNEQGRVRIGIGAGFGEDLFEGECFETLDADEFPAGLNHLVDEKAFVLTFRVELGAEAGGEGVEVLDGLMGEDGEVAAETVTGRILTGGGFTFRRDRAGGLGGILPVREYLCCGAHLPTFNLSGRSKIPRGVVNGIRARKWLLVSGLYDFLGLWKSGCEGVSFHRRGGGKPKPRELSAAW